MYRFKITHDNFPTNPFKDWDCGPPLMSLYERRRTDYGKGSIQNEIKEKLTQNIVKFHQNKLAEILEVDISDCESLDEKVNDIIDEIDKASMKNLGKICEILKMPYFYGSSRGYSQGDYSEVLIVLTQEFFEKTGCDPKNADEILKGTKKLYDNWAWGDVYQIRVEKEIKLVQIPSEDFDKGDFTTNAQKISKWESDEHGCCSGFYGDDWSENGIFEDVPDEIKKFVKGKDFEIDKWYKITTPE